MVDSAAAFSANKLLRVPPYASHELLSITSRRDWRNTSRRVGGASVAAVAKSLSEGCDGCGASLSIKSAIRRRRRQSSRGSFLPHKYKPPFAVSGRHVA